jgi:hypothetical protein
MMGSIQGVSKIYGMLLSLFPRDFQNEFKEEMETVFTANLEEAAKTGATLVVRACFFELLDLPVNLVGEHLSSLRKGNPMKNISSEVGRSRVVLMAALGMMVGWILINWEGNQYFHILSLHLQTWEFDLVHSIINSLPVILCGLMLGIAAGVSRRAFLRIGLWTTAGGMLGHLVSLPVRMVNSLLLSRTPVMVGSWRYDTTFLLGLVAVMCAYGLFYGAGLGLAFGNWKTCKKFALIGLIANAVGMLAGYYIVSGLRILGLFSSLSSPTIPLSYFTWSIMGALAGGILGWFFGRERQPESDRVIPAGNA